MIWLLVDKVPFMMIKHILLVSDVMFVIFLVIFQ
jgi:hypothetical protein